MLRPIEHIHPTTESSTACSVLSITLDVDVINVRTLSKTSTKLSSRLTTFYTVAIIVWPTRHDAPDRVDKTADSRFLLHLLTAMVENRPEL
jgi:hypothetical protein